MFLIHAHRRASGFTLISTLVGLVVGLLSIAAMLTLYRNVVNSSLFVEKQAVRDGQVATGSLVSQQEMQQAGFGITNAAIGTDLVVLSNAALSDGKLKGTAVGSYSSTVTGNAVIWGFNPTAASGTTDPAGYQCEGLLVTTQGLLWLTPASCKSAANWQGVNWKTNQLASARNLGPLSIFQATPGSCFPYQQTAPSSSFQVSYYLPTQAQQKAGQSNGSSSSDSSGNSENSVNDHSGDGYHDGLSHFSSTGSFSGSSATSSSTPSTSDAAGLPAISSSTLSNSSAVINIPAFSVCLPNFKP
ncbi:PilW family protein [Dyella humi]|uniref:Pilus assembly protein PilX n=1 Tax=Dyella humi TaxID=1770547 RepID=A0ABW8IF96_9GAMM